MESGAIDAARGRGAVHAHRRGGLAALAALCAADVLVTLDGMVVSVALPSIQHDLGFSAAALQWVVTAYTLALGTCLLLGGRVADALGRRRTLLVGLATFTAASAIAGASRTPALLLAARALAGLGAALAIPAALALIAVTFAEGSARNRALGFMSASMDVGMVVGAVLGGVITSLLGWPWVFYVIVVVGLATLAITPRAVEESRPTQARQPLNGPSALAAAGGLALLIFTLTRAQAVGLGAAGTLAPLAGSLVLLAGFAVLESHAESPLLPRRLLRRRRALAAYVAIVANAGGFVSVIVLSTLYLQRILGFSALAAGLAFVPLAVSAGAGGPLAAPLIDRFGVRAVVAASLTITAAGVALLARVPVDGRYPTAILPIFAVTGFTFATAAVPLTAEAVADAPPTDHGIAAALFQTFTHVGGAIVLALVIIAAAGRTDAALDDGAGHAAALTAGYRLGFVLAAAFLLVGAAAATALLRPRAGRRRSVRAPK
jgi:EmrB/QacA subfamily drug resistance transporter